MPSSKGKEKQILPILKDENTSEVDESDADAPRAAQWVDEDDLESESESHKLPKNDLTSLEDDLSSLPMGALRRAQKVITVKNPDISDSESESSQDSLDEDQALQKQEWSTKPRLDIAKRKNKHAPTEVTSKRPVTRRRTVVDVQAPQARDPRFLPMTGEFSSHKFAENYRFLSESHKSELSTLRDNIKRARKLLASSPRDTRQEREAEISRLELAMKRAESTVNKDRRDAIEQEALRAASKQEREKQQSGKGKWYMKDSEKKEFLVRAKYDALAEQGGQRAVKKSIEKKRKKIAHKEKKSRPFAKGFMENPSKRPDESNSHDRKRRKFE